MNAPLLRISLGFLCGAIAIALGGSAFLEMGAGLATLLTEPIDGPSRFLLGVIALPFASFAGWGAWRLFH